MMRLLEEVVVMTLNSFGPVPLVTTVGALHSMPLLVLPLLGRLLELPSNWEVKWCVLMLMIAVKPMRAVVQMYRAVR
jgi:predicted anti-sigma-YlaC factor YlaD